MIGEFGPVTSRTVDLNYEQLLTLEGRPGTRVKVIFGGVWLTEEGQLQDVFAQSGDEVALRSRRLSVLEGLGATRIELIDPIAADRFRTKARAFGAMAGGLWRRTRAFVSAPAWTPDTPRATLAALAAVVGVAIPLLVAVGVAATATTLSQYL